MNIKYRIMWIDDEIELLRPHIIFLEDLGYEISPVTNAEDALILLNERSYDLILLDEMLHGMDGLTALLKIKEMNPSLPVVMITKSEEESIMEEALGSKIDDYLTKPVNPSQILMSCKRILESKRIASERISREYSFEFNRISQALMSPMDWQEWIQIYMKIVEREVELDDHLELGLRQTLLDQKRECNIEFGKFIERCYSDWIWSEDRPMLSTDIILKKVMPLIGNGENVVFIVMDNLRLDQWLVIEELLYPDFNVTRDYYFSILPTATPYSRNGIFSGLFPDEIKVNHPEYFMIDSPDELSQNRYEAQLLDCLLNDNGIRLKSDAKYFKILDMKHANMTYRNISSFSNLPLVSIVINFVDFLAHSRSDSEILKEITPDEAAFRSLTKSWFEHSVLLKILKKISKLGSKIVLTSDHGNIRSMHGVKVIGDRETSTNLRYKFGKNIKCDPKHAMIVDHPDTLKLPSPRLNTNYLIAKEDYYFVYPTDYHYYLNHYKDTFQHGGISIEEMILPLITMCPK
ncbi:PglZ domain-containing protein [candidate division KSB1 bacterium]|nr:PglZ domain-containing protein [candidate division KSB1 bacterium]